MSAQKETPKEATHRIMTMIQKRVEPFVVAQVFPATGIEEVQANRGRTIHEQIEYVTDETADPVDYYTYTMSHMEGDGGKAKAECEFCQRGEQVHMALVFPTKTIVHPAYQVPHRCAQCETDIPIGTPLVRLVTDKGTSRSDGRAIAFSSEFHNYECLVASLKAFLKTLHKGDWVK